MTGASTCQASPAAAFAANGWALVPGIFGHDELEALRSEADRLWRNRHAYAARGVIPNSVARPDRLDPIIDLSPLFAKLARDPRLSRLAAEALGGDEAQLFKDKLIYKPPGAIGYSVHQDGAYWQGHDFELERILTMIIFLDDATAENGAVEFVSGLHGALLTEPGKIADPDEDGLGAFTLVPAEAGDVVLVHSLVPHRSGGNRSASPRRALFLSYGTDRRPDLYGRYQRSRAAS